MRTDWRLIFLLYAVGLLAAAQFAKISLTLDALGEEYPGAEGFLPWIVSLLSLTGIVFGAVAGAIVGRFGVRRVMVLGLFAAAALSALQAILPPLSILLVLRILEGAAHLALVVSAPTLMSVSSEARHRPAVMGLWGTFFGVGFAISATVVPWLGGPRWVYLAHAVTLIALAAILIPRLPGADQDAAPKEGWIATHVVIYSNARTAAPAIVFFWHTVSFLGILTYMPEHLGGWTAPILPLIALVGTLGAGALARYMPARHLAMISFSLTILGMNSLWAAPETIKPAIGLILMLTVGMIPGAAFAAIPELNSESRDQARANGALAQLGNVGTAVTTPLYASAVGMAGIGGLSLLSAGLAAAGLVATWVVHRNLGHST